MNRIYTFLRSVLLLCAFISLAFSRSYAQGCPYTITGGTVYPVVNGTGTINIGPGDAFYQYMLPGGSYEIGPTFYYSGTCNNPSGCWCYQGTTQTCGSYYPSGWTVSSASNYLVGQNSYNCSPWNGYSMTFSYTCTAPTTLTPPTLTSTATQTTTGTIGSGQWNIYCYNTGDAYGTTSSWAADYSGYYSVSALSFNTTNASPSWGNGASITSSTGQTNGYLGCYVSPTSMSWSCLRYGPSCGIYTVYGDCDDYGQFFLNGAQEFSIASCCHGLINEGNYVISPTDIMCWRVSQGGGGSYSNISFATVAQAALTGGAITSTVSVCATSTPATIANVTSETGGTSASIKNGSSTYAWYFSIGCTGTWTLLNSTSASANSLPINTFTNNTLAFTGALPGTISTICFYRQVTDKCGSTANSNTCTMTNYTLPVITGVSNMCNTTTTEALTSTGVTATWTSSSGTFSGSPGSSVTYNFPTIAAPTASQVVTITATNGACAPTATLTVYNNPVITGTANVCNSTTTETLNSTITGTTWTASSGSFASATGTTVTYNVPTIAAPTASQVVTITATNNLCTPTATFTVYNNPVLSGQSSVCNSTTTETLSSTVTGTGWTSNFGSFSPSSGTTVTYSVPTIAAPTASDAVVITLTNGSCTPTAAFTVYNSNITVNGVPGSPICNSTTTEVLNSGITGTTWTATGGTFTGSPGNTVTYNVPTIAAPTASQVVTVTAANGLCNSTATFTVDNNNITITGAPATNVCNSTTTEALTSGITGTTWTATYGSFSSPTGASVTYNVPTFAAPTASEVEVITATNAACSKTATFTVYNSNLTVSGTGPVCTSTTTEALTSGITGTTWTTTSGTFTGAPGNSVTYNVPTFAAPTASQAVTITATNVACTKTAAFTVYNNPVITGTSSVCNSTTTEVLNGAITGTTWTTNYGSFTPATGVTVTYSVPTFAAPTTSEVVVITATNNVCTPTATFTIYNSNITIGGTANVCNSTTTQALTSSISGTTWTATAGSFSPTSGASVTYNVPTIAAPTASQAVTITAAVGGCTKTAVFTVYNNPVITGTSSVCNSTTTEVLNGAITGTAWTTNYGSFTPTSGVTVTYSVPTFAAPTASEVVVVTATNNVCTPTATFTVYNNNLTIGGTANVCNSTTTQALTSTIAGTTWTATAGSFVSPTGASVTYNVPSIAAPTASQAVTITAANGGCTKTAVFTVYNNPVITGTASVCNSTTTEVLNGAITGTAWTTSSGSFTGSPGVTVTYNVPTFAAPTASQAVTITATNNLCMPTASFTVYNNNLTITGAPAVSVCNSTTTEALTSGITGTTWTATYGSFVSPLGASVTYNVPTFAAPTASEVEVITASNGLCSKTATFAVYNNNLTIGGTTPTVCSSTTTEALSSTITGTAWTASSGSFTGSPSASVTYNVPTIAAPTASQTVTITAANGNCSTTNTFTVYNNNLTITGAPSPSVCNSTTTEVLSSGITGTTWTTNYGTYTPTSGATVTFNVPTIAAPTASEVVVLTAANGACNSTATFTVYNNITLTGVPSPSVCNATTTETLNSSITGTAWTAAYGTFAGSPGTTVTYNVPTFAAPTASEVEVITASNASCTTTATFTVYNSNLTISGTPTSPICNSTTTEALSSTISGTAWTANYGTFTGTPGASVTYNVPTIAAPATSEAITVTAANGGCTSTATFTIYNNNFSILGITSPACNSSTEVLNSALAATWTATAGSFTGSPGSTVTYNLTSAPGTVTITATVGACTSTADLIVYASSTNAYEATTSTNATALYEYCSESGWTYYADPAHHDRWLFAIYKNGNNFNPTVQLQVNPSGNYTSINGGSGHVNGSYLLSRYWNVDMTGSLSTPVKVKFYYDTADSLAAVSAMTSALSAAGGCMGSGGCITAWKWFKSVGTDFNPINIVGNSFTAFNNINLTGVYGADNGIRYVEFDSITSFSGGTGGIGFNQGLPPGPLALPVTLVSFTAEAVDNSYIRTDWVTAQEIDDKGFILERSTDGIKFDSVGWVQGAGNSVSEHDYSFSDPYVAPNVIYYYRLKQVDMNGREQYSQIASAVILGSSGFSIEGMRPNPTSGALYIYLVSNTNVNAKIEVSDMLGRIVQVNDWQVSNGYNGTQIDLSSLAIGTYNVTIHSGNIVTSKKLVISR